MTEEPGAGILHAGICAGGGWATARPYGDDIVREMVR
jgi:hypothetical protein